MSYKRVCYRSVHNSMLLFSTKHYAAGLHKTVRCRTVHNTMLHACKQQYATRQYTKACYMSYKRVCYISVHNSMLLFSTKHYAAGLHTTVRCRTVHNTMLHVSTQEYATGLTKSMLQICIQQYATVQYDAVRCVCMIQLHLFRNDLDSLHNCIPFYIFLLLYVRPA